MIAVYQLLTEGWWTTTHRSTLGATIKEKELVATHAISPPIICRLPFIVQFAWESRLQAEDVVYTIGFSSSSKKGTPCLLSGCGCQWHGATAATGSPNAPARLLYMRTVPRSTIMGSMVIFVSGVLGVKLGCVLGREWYQEASGRGTQWWEWVRKWDLKFPMARQTCESTLFPILNKERMYVLRKTPGIVFFDGQRGCY